MVSASATKSVVLVSLSLLMATVSTQPTTCQQCLNGPTGVSGVWCSDTSTCVSSTSTALATCVSPVYAYLTCLSNNELTTAVAPPAGTLPSPYFLGYWTTYPGVSIPAGNDIVTLNSTSSPGLFPTMCATTCQSLPSCIMYTLVYDTANSLYRCALKSAFPASPITIAPVPSNSYLTVLTSITVPLPTPSSSKTNFIAYHGTTVDSTAHASYSSCLAGGTPNTALYLYFEGQVYNGGSTYLAFSSSSPAPAVSSSPEVCACICNSITACQGFDYFLGTCWFTDDSATLPDIFAISYFPLGVEANSYGHYSKKAIGGILEFLKEAGITIAVVVSVVVAICIGACVWCCMVNKRRQATRAPIAVTTIAGVQPMYGGQPQYYGGQPQQQYGGYPQQPQYNQQAPQQYPGQYQMAPQPGGAPAAVPIASGTRSPQLSKAEVDMTLLKPAGDKKL